VFYAFLFIENAFSHGEPAPHFPLKETRVQFFRVRPRANVRPCRLFSGAFVEPLLAVPINIINGGGGGGGGSPRILGMIADPLDVLCAEHQMDAELELRRIVHHIVSSSRKKAMCIGRRTLLSPFVQTRHCRGPRSVRRIGIRTDLTLDWHESGSYVRGRGSL